MIKFLLECFFGKEKTFNSIQTKPANNPKYVPTQKEEDLYREFIRVFRICNKDFLGVFRYEEYKNILLDGKFYTTASEIMRYYIISEVKLEYRLWVNTKKINYGADWESFINEDDYQFNNPLIRPVLKNVGGWSNLHKTGIIPYTILPKLCVDFISLYSKNTCFDHNKGAIKPLYTSEWVGKKW